ncbi:sugar phosphate isomerase/epimerase family protein [Halanaerobium salsuginis]|uniref:Sugar phosphate isomerase/epimerase n=1 Tax=Halanaerobium salsuginis TaxID=29563 RepID=A0A1I4IRL5_9FIRM|nr:sugar phosphate isomerase/epimerase family protein [Halanaerobium salsuginis]SFL56707.1 Sugar phosphate isomerase/epimerase [Halanaerobium salsuginis]
MYYTGFADEAAASIDQQIAVTKELGWHYIEAREIDGVNLTDLSEAKFAEIAEKLAKAGVEINCFGSAVANWGKDPRFEDSFKRSLAELARAIPRMKQLGTKMIRGMSYGIPRDLGPQNPELEAKIIASLKKMVKLCAEADLIYVHENCMNYFSQSYQHMEQLTRSINSDNFKIVFDTGNPLMADNRMGAEPYSKQTSWGAYQQLKDHIYYVHIKDGNFVKETAGIFPEMNYTYPGEGNAEVKKILVDLLKNGYDGGLSIEPHMGAVYHETENLTEAEAKYNTYLEYGKRFMSLMTEIKAEAVS